MGLINSFSKKDLDRTQNWVVLDLAMLVLVMMLFLLLMNAASDMWMQYEIGDTITIDLNPKMLPYYAARTVLRMFIALFFSFIFAFIFGSWAAKNTHAEKVIIPLIDVLQSIPVIGFLEVSFIWFIYGFQGSFIGPELASIFAVFVSQVWNLILSYYQSLKTMPRELNEVMWIYRLSPLQRFLKLEVPFAAPGLVWNAMLSLSAGWFFVVAGEAITIANHNVSLPGIGSYIAAATTEGNYYAIYYAVTCLFFVIMVYDQLLFRPLNYWIERRNNPEASRSNVVWRFFSGSIFSRFLLHVVKNFTNRIRAPKRHYYKPSFRLPRYLGRVISWGLMVFFFLWVLYCTYDSFLLLSWEPLFEATLLGAYTAFRVFFLVGLCCLVWFPVGLYLGMNARVADILQPVIQFLAAFPPNMLYPLVGSVVVVKGYNPNLWLSPLIVLGTQWYILFNIIAGVRALPADLLLMAKSLNLSTWRYYWKVVIPGVLPSMLTGVITAVGGAWNTSIVAEAVEWKGKIIYAKGLGAFIMKASRNSERELVFVGVLVMCLYVFLINRILWMPLYQWVDKRYGGGRT